MNEDAIASSTIDIFFNPIYNSELIIEPTVIDSVASPIAEEAVDYIKWCFDYIDGGIKSLLTHLMNAPARGLSLHEMVWERGADYDGKTTNAITRLSPIALDTIHKFNFDENMNFIGITQTRRALEGKFSYVEIPINKLLVFSWRSMFGDPRGRALLRPARKAFLTKRTIWNATGRAASRGAGIPVFTIGQSAGKDEISKMRSDLQTIAKTVGNSDNCYMIEQEGKLTFRLAALESQGYNMEIIKQCNNEMIYNMLSQFIVSGIGESGSRAATSEHKAPYLEFLQSIMNAIEDVLNTLIVQMIEASYLYGKLSWEEYPKAKLERMLDKDLTSVATNLSNLARSSLVRWTDTDEDYIRGIFGLPSMETIRKEDNENVEEAPVEEQPIEQAPEMPIDQPVDEELAHKHKHGIELQASLPDLYMRLPDKIKGTFELQSAIDHFENMSLKAKSTVNSVFNKVVADAAKQLGQIPVSKFKGYFKPDQMPSLRFKGEMIDKLGSLFDDGFKRGKGDIKKEVEKVTGKKEAPVSLAKSPIVVTGTKNVLKTKVDTLFSALENAMINEAQLITPQMIEQAGGVESYFIQRFADTQKDIKADLEAITTGGYTAGRNDEVINEIESNENLKLIYTAVLDGAICEECAPFDGVMFTPEEAEGEGLNIEGTPINPNCLGGVRCRCQWAPVEG